MRKTLALALVLVFVTSILHAQATARVGAWNIEWLGVPGSRSGSGKNVKQKASDIADYIIDSNVDILGLEEVSLNGPNNTNVTIAEV